MAKQWGSAGSAEFVTWPPPAHGCGTPQRSMVLHRYQQERSVLPLETKNAALLLISAEYVRCWWSTTNHGPEAAMLRILPISLSRTHVKLTSVRDRRLPKKFVTWPPQAHGCGTPRRSMVRHRYQQERSVLLLEKKERCALAEIGRVRPMLVEYHQPLAGGTMLRILP